MQVFAMLPSTVVLEYLSGVQKQILRKVTDIITAHPPSIRVIVAAFLGFNSFNVLFFLSDFILNSLSLSSSVCFHPSSVTNFSCSCEKAESNDWVLHFNIYMF